MKMAAIFLTFLLGAVCGQKLRTLCAQARNAEKCEPFRINVQKYKFFRNSATAVSKSANRFEVLASMCPKNANPFEGLAWDVPKSVNFSEIVVNVCPKVRTLSRLWRRMCPKVRTLCIFSSKMYLSFND